STVCWIMERSPSRARTCLACARRERGQKRVPLPPARITGRKSISFDIDETSYPTKTRFASDGAEILPESGTGAKRGRSRPVITRIHETSVLHPLAGSSGKLAANASQSFGFHPSLSGRGNRRLSALVVVPHRRR